MTPRPPRWAHAVAAAAALLALAVTASCGGGGAVGSGGTGAPVTGYSIGTVNGFGSVIVDSVSFDDLHASVVAETAPGIDSLAEVRLGERVAVAYVQPGIARQIRVLTALSGPATTSVTNSRFTMLGQTVVINTAAGSGPTTQLGGGYSRASDVRAGDVVDVHGVLVLQNGAWILSATRIDKLTGTPEYLRVTGVVAGLGGGSTTFSLGTLTVDASAATLVPRGSTLANGAAVTVLALPASYLASGASTSRLAAAQIRLDALQESSLDDALSGSISSLDSTAKVFMLGAQKVSYAGATLSPAGAMPASGIYVQVQGRVGRDGILTATTLDLHGDGSDDDSELKGTIVAFDAVANQFKLRDVLVDASTARLQGCPGAGLGNGLYVEVQGTLASSGVVARTIQCESEPAGGSIERQGRSSAVDTAARTFTLTSEQGAALTVRWADTTFFGNGLTPATLSGKTIDVQGSFVGTVLMATKIKLDD